MYKHAVLAWREEDDCYDVIWNEKGDECLDHQGFSVPSLSQLHACMEEHKLDVLWAMPGSRFEQEIKAEHFLDLHGQGYDAYIPRDCLPEAKPQRRLYGARIRSISQKKGSHDRFFMFPGNREWKIPRNHDKGVWHTGEPENLLNTVNYLQEEYQVPIVWSPGHIGMDVLKVEHERDQVEITLLTEDQKTLFLESVARGCCNSVSWANQANLKGTHIYGFDKNAQFLGAAQSVQLGNGAFHKSRKFDPYVVGFWYFHVENHRGPFNGVKLPRILDRDEGWAHTDLIQAALHGGTMLTIQGGYVWQEHDKYLERWAKGMWRHRMALKSEQKQDAIARANAASTAKMVPNTAVGLFVRTGRPHWNHSIVHRAVANQAYSLARIYREFGILPCLVSKDAFYIASFETDPTKVVPGLLEHKQEQRGYKLIGRCEITEEIIAAFGRIDDKKFGVPGIESAIGRSMHENLPSV